MRTKSAPERHYFARSIKFINFREEVTMYNLSLFFLVYEFIIFFPYVFDQNYRVKDILQLLVTLSDNE